MGAKIIKIEKIEIGNGALPLVIPEIGINHGGSIAIAKEMVFAAYKSGAKLIKHQTHIVEDEMSLSAQKVIPGNANISIYEIMKKSALSEAEEWELMQYTQSLGMVFLSTPFSRAAADRLESFGVSGYKIGSGELNNYPLIEHIAAFKKPMILSTGMNDIDNIKKAVRILERYDVDYALMHTTNLYPTQPAQVRLGAMQELMREFPNKPVGLSDHTTNNNACIAAISLGASLVERHFTDTMQRQGPDIVCSMDVTELGKLLVAAREIPQMQGGDKKPLPEEQVTIDFAFATIVTIKEIKRGEKFTKDNIWVKRPGTGEILAEHFDNTLGERAAQDILCDIHLTKAMIATDGKIL